MFGIFGLFILQLLLIPKIFQVLGWLLNITFSYSKHFPDKTNYQYAQEKRFLRGQDGERLFYNRLQGKMVDARETFLKRLRASMLYGGSISKILHMVFHRVW
ncbi:MAG: hypothetical protein CL402_00580 [Acidiferrobacteraceae bacterium]|nr:hypothetical protein [Acidiferrobacteraceae bacterium]